MFVKKNKGVIIALSVGLFLFLALAAVVAFMLFGNTKVKDVNGLYKALALTSVKYAQEDTALKQSNKVLFNWNKALTEGAQQTISADDIFTLEIVDSKKDKRLDLSLDFPYLSDDQAEFYLHDEEILFGFEGYEYLASTSSTFEEDLISLVEETGSQETVTQLRTFFEELEFSYDGLFSTERLELDYAAFTTRYTEVMKKLLSYGDFSVNDDVVPYDDNGNTISRKVQNVSLAFTNTDIADWLENDLVPTLQDDPFFTDTVGAIRDLEDAAMQLRGLDDSQYNLSFVIYKGHVIETKLDINIDTYEVSFAFAAQGEKNLLDDISISMIDEDGDEISLSAKGNHINGPIFYSEIYYEDYSQEATFVVNWDTDEKANNFVINGTDTYGDDFDFVMTFATKDKGILIECDIEGMTAEYRVEALSQLKPLPTNTVPLGSIDLMGLYIMYADLFDSLYDYEDYDYNLEDYDVEDYDDSLDAVDWDALDDIEGWEEWTDEEWDEWLSTFE